MKIKYILGMFVLMGLSNCTPNATETEFLVESNDFKVSSISGDIDITMTAPGTAGYLSTTTSFKMDNTNGAELSQPRLRHNLSGKPYHLSIELSVDTGHENNPVITFVSDFERPMKYGEKYRMQVTSILADGIAYVPGNTGGNIEFKFPNQNTTKLFGFGFISELEIIIYPESEGGKQDINLIGQFVRDAAKNSEVEVGTFNVQVKGENLIDLSFF